MEPLNAANPYGATLEEVLAGETLSGDALMTYIATRLSSLDEDIKILIGQQQEALAKKQYINAVRDWAAGLEHGSSNAGTEGTAQVNRIEQPFQGGHGRNPSMTAQPQVPRLATDPGTTSNGPRGSAPSLAQVSQAEPNMSTTSNGPRGAAPSYMQLTNAAANPDGDQAAETNPDGNQPRAPGSFPEGTSDLGGLPAELWAAFESHCGGDRGINEGTLEAFNSKLDSVLDEINGASELNMIRLQQLMGQRQVCIQLVTNLLSKLSAGQEGIAANCK